MARLAISIIALGLIVASSVLAAPPERIQLISEYRNSQDTPDHLVFGSTIRSIKMRADADPEMAALIVQSRFRLDLPEAEVMLGKMLQAAEDLEHAKYRQEYRMVCGSSRSNVKQAVYKQFDALDIVRENLTRQSFEQFVSALNDNEVQRLLEWLDIRKESYTHRTVKHQSVYEGTDSDPRTAVDQYCAELELQGFGR